MALYISGEIVLSREAYSKSSSASEGSSSGVRVLRRTGLGKGICAGMDDFDFVAAGVGTGEADGEGDEGTINFSWGQTRMHRYFAVAGMTLGIAYVIWLLPKIGAFGGMICLLVGMPLSGVALCRARRRADRNGIQLALAAFAVNVIGLIIAIPLMLSFAAVYGITVTGHSHLDSFLSIILWCVTLWIALRASRNY